MRLFVRYLFMFVIVFCDWKMILYALKIKGKAKIPDYVQLRDEEFTLLAYFRLDRPEKAIFKAGLSEKESEIMSFMEKIPFGKMHKMKL